MEANNNTNTKDVVKEEVKDTVAEGAKSTVEEEVKDYVGILVGPLEGNPPIVQPQPVAVEESKGCGFYMIKKKRNCRMLARPGKMYCAEHGHLEPVEKTEGEAQVGDQDKSTRVPCPLDPKHTVFKHKLEKHLKVCNAIPKHPIYYTKDVNVPEPSPTVQLKKVQNLLDSELLGLLVKIDEAFIKTFAEFHRSCGLKDSKSQPMNEASDAFNGDGGLGGRKITHSLKHSFQVDSLCLQFDNTCLILPNTAYVEMGCGTGELTCGLIEYMKTHSLCINTAKYILVDRESHRHKLDNKLKYEDDLAVSRIRIDIKDLSLEKVPELQETKNVVAYSKHLCGEATDLALRALFNGKSELESKVVGLVMAACCHHRCKWNTYVGKKFLLKCGFTEEDFGPLLGISSWAVCGTGTAKLTGTNQNEVGTNPTYRRLNLTHGTRYSYGNMVKKLLDFGRLEFIEEHDLDASIKAYAGDSITGEGTVLLARRNVFPDIFFFK